MTAMVQVRLRSGSWQRTCWVPTDKKPRLGCQITLKNSEDPDQRWTIEEMSEPKEARLIHTDWRVGGL